MDQTHTLIISPDKLDNTAAGNAALQNSPYSGGSLGEDDQLQVGMIVGGKYRLLSSLQERASNSVFIAHPLDDLSVRCVIKIQRHNISKTSGKRFLREANLHSKIEHNCIVKLLDYWSEDYGQFIVLEFIDGKSLKACCADLEFDETSALIVAMEIGNALQYVWENFKIIHRDIKPENIMLNSQNYIKLLDFGIAKNQKSSPDTYLTVDNAILGTPGYMSPEQFTNAKNASIQSDMFSLGATLYYLMTKEIPFTGSDLSEVYRNTCSNTPPDIRSKRPEVSEGFVTLLNALMQPDPQNRPASWTDIINYIQELMQGE